MKRSRCCTGVLVAAALAMVIETSCNPAPAPHTEAEPARVITKIHMRDNTLYVTSRYAVTDSFLVIQELLRDDKYYNNPDEPHIYGKVEPMKRPPANVDLPLMIRVSDVETIGPWKEPRETRNGVLAAVVIVAGLAAALAIVISQVELGGD